jgi:hypothetical protein
VADHPVEFTHRGLVTTRRADATHTWIPHSPFFIDWAGQVLVRKNLALFAVMLEEFDLPTYDQRVNAYDHRHFGLSIDEKDVAHFTFHLSLVQQILTEELNGAVLPWLAL